MITCLQALDELESCLAGDDGLGLVYVSSTIDIGNSSTSLAQVTLVTLGLTVLELHFLLFVLLYIMSKNN